MSTLSWQRTKSGSNGKWCLSGLDKVADYRAFPIQFAVGKLRLQLSKGSVETPRKGQLHIAVGEEEGGGYAAEVKAARWRGCG